MKFFFILGTDTHCGKTYITCQLSQFFQNTKHRVLALKPVVSGYSGDGQDDVSLLEKYQINRDKICQWLLKTPVSPHLAARIDGQTITAAAIAEFCALGREGYDYVFIEGAGGLMVPLNDNETWLDFLILSKIPVILVVGMRLGCLNHALLTADVLKRYSIECRGWIANAIDPSMLLFDENVATLEQKLPWPLLSRVLSHETIAQLDL